MIEHDAMCERYGPWAVIAGASEGIGRAFARQLAAAGVPCILVARRQGPLDELCDEIRVETGIECVAATDLCFAESLWAELRPHNVDVLYMALGTTDTPNPGEGND